ncbi:MAG: hypothetical protein V4609_13340, partial [Pseudomonadota bacterium]
MNEKALVHAVFGARGTGKTAHIKQLIERAAPPRLIVWDFKHDPTLRDLGTPYTDLAAFVLAALTAFAYAELVTKYPRAAGAALYTNKAFGIQFF